jgi:hypothetical protein
MRESRPYGSERGAFSNGRPYRDRTSDLRGTGTRASTPAPLPRPHTAEGVPLDPALDRRCFTCPTRGQYIERLLGLDEDRSFTGSDLVAAKDHVDVEWTQLDAPAYSTVLLGGDERRAGAEERVDDDVASIGEVEEGVLEHGGRFDGRMVFEAATSVRAERRVVRIGPDV